MSYNLYDAAYSFDLFDVDYKQTKTISKTTQAKKQKNKILPYKNTETETQPKEHPLRNAFIIFQILAICIIFIVPFFMNLNSRRQMVEISKDIEKQKIMLAEENSEKVRLEAEFNAMMTINKVEDYATNVLGMVKLTPYNTSRFDFSGEDCVVLCAKEDKGEEISFVQKILSYFD